MPVAAVPAYLGKDFKQASPGMRFSMYLQVWGVDHETGERTWGTEDARREVRGPTKQARQVKSNNKASALQEALHLNRNDSDCLSALADRQQAIFDASCQPNNGMTLDARATAPFTTGLGIAHPLENGFSFLSPYGLPYLPGSGIKGVLRQAVRELASGDWRDAEGWPQPTDFPWPGGGENTPTLTLLDVLFGRESNAGDGDHFRGVLTVWDAIPRLKNHHLKVDIMTPHHQGYFQKGEPPHENDSPLPIQFLTLAPGTGFTFYVQCDTHRLARVSPALTEDNNWQTLLEAAFQHAFEWLGFGGKTAVGYGAMEKDENRQQERQEAQERAAREKRQQGERAAEEARLAALSPEEREREHKRDTIAAFAKAVDAALQDDYTPGGTFDDSRSGFLNNVTEWPDADLRADAADVLERTLSLTSKKKKKKLKAAINTLRDETP